MTSVLLASVVLLAVMTGCVLLSMFVEQRSIARRRARLAAVPVTQGPAPQVEIDGFDEVDEVDEWSADDVDTDAGSSVTAPPPEVLVVLNGRDAADRAAAVLFAAYVASGGPAARRAAAWVTAAAPSSLEGASFEPGTDLRGRTVAVRRLLEHDEDGRCWLTLRDGVDIRRGVERHPVTCPTLEGALLFWSATRAAMSALPTDLLVRIVDTVDELEPVWGPTTGGVELRAVAAALRSANDAGATVRVQVPLAALGPVDDGTRAASTPSTHETV
jgi:hypothetical protein